MKATDKQKQALKDYYQRNKEKLNEKSKIRYEENKEKILSKHNEYIKNNPEKLIKSQRNWYLKNRELKIKKSCDYVKKNKIKHSLYANKRRSEKKNTSNDSINDIEIIKMLSCQKEKCIYCDTLISNSFHIDHIVPLAKNGSHTICNIQLLCPQCNYSKGKKTHEEFLKYKNIINK